VHTTEISAPFSNSSMNSYLRRRFKNRNPCIFGIHEKKKGYIEK